MGVYAVTGSASGMGRAVVDKLTAAGHTVIGVDIQGADVVADLSTEAGRRQAIRDVLSRAGGTLDGAVLAAGVGPLPGAEKLPLIASVNYLGVVELLDGWRTALAASGSAKVVVFGSNSTTTTPAVPGRTVRALLARDVAKAARSVRLFGKGAAPMMYAGSKIAVSRWVRRNAVTRDWAGAGIRLNVLAPGAIMTPLLEKQLATPAEAKMIKRFPVRSAASAMRVSSRTGWCSCCPTPRTSCAAASSSWTAVRTPTSVPTRGRAPCRSPDWSRMSGSSSASAATGKRPNSRNCPRFGSAAAPLESG